MLAHTLSSEVFMKRLFAIAIAASLATLPLMAAQAQAGLTFWAGYAQSADSGSANMSNKGAQLGAQLGLPLVPIALRAAASSSFGCRCCKCMVWPGGESLRSRIPRRPTAGKRGAGSGSVRDDSAFLAR